MPLLLRLLVFTPLALSLAPAARSQDAPRTEQQLARSLDSLVGNPDLSNAVIGITVMDPATRRTIYAHDHQKSMMPASNTKLYTTAAALDQLGPDFVYVTRLEADASSIRDGVLEANLIVRGSGDPAIGGRFNEGDITEVFRLWADSLKARGIRTVAGDIIGDDDLFDDVGLGYGWSWDDEPWWYSAEISALSFNDNAVDFTTEPAARPGGPGRVTWEPLQTRYVDVRNATVTLPASASLKEGYTRVRDGNEMVLSSQVPVGYIERESISVHNPTLYFVHVLREVLLEQGIAVLGQPVDVDDLSIKPANPSTLRIASHTSRPLRDVVAVINKRSQNLYAEQVLKTLGALRPDSLSEAASGSAGMGWAAGMRTLAAAQVDTSRIQLVDGSGLSRMNLVTSQMTATLLTHMANHPDPEVRGAFMDSLPIAGVDGSLQYRMRNGPATNNARAKTGTLANVTALSGYVTTSTGRLLVFSIMVNHYTGPSLPARTLLDTVVETLARYAP